jgi:hypothetical protein
MKKLQTGSIDFWHPNPQFGDGENEVEVASKDGSFDGGNVNAKAQLRTCLFLSVPAFPRLNPAAVKLLTNTFGDAAQSTYNSWSIYNRAVFLNTAVGAAALGANYDNAKFEGFYYGDRVGPNTMGQQLPFGFWISGFTGLKAPEREGSLSSKRYGNPGSLEIEKENGRFHFDFDLFKGTLFSALPGGDHNGEDKFNTKFKRPTHPGDVINQIQKRDPKVNTGVSCINIIPDLITHWNGHEV